MVFRTETFRILIREYINDKNYDKIFILMKSNYPNIIFLNSYSSSLITWKSCNGGLFGLPNNPK
jgi:hypothetical protein